MKTRKSVQANKQIHKAHKQKSKIRPESRQQEMKNHKECKKLTILETKHVQRSVREQRKDTYREGGGNWTHQGGTSKET